MNEPIDTCKLDRNEQSDAAANKAMTQIAEQNDSRFVALDVFSRRYNRRRDDHLLDTAEYFLRGRLEMSGMVCNISHPVLISRMVSPYDSDLHHAHWSWGIAQAAVFRKLQYSGSAIKTQESGQLDFFKLTVVMAASSHFELRKVPPAPDHGRGTSCVSP